MDKLKAIYKDRLSLNSIDSEDCVLDAMRLAYNQAIQDVEVNIECCMNLSEGFEYPTVKWDSISKLKIK